VRSSRPKGVKVVVVVEQLIERFAAATPVTVMARILLQRAVSPDVIDGVFAEHRGRQYERELLFSTLVKVMTLVALGMQPSVHAAAKSLGSLGASLQALYEKIAATSTDLVRALVRTTAASILKVRERLPAIGTPTLSGYRLRVIDGNHLPSSEKRVKPLRGFHGAALPGQAVVIYEPDTDTVLDVVLGEDGYESERALLTKFVPEMRAGDLYLADRLYGVWNVMLAIAAQGACFNIRARLDSIKMEPVGDRRQIAQTARETVYEQAVSVRCGKESLKVRRIDIELAKPTQDGEKMVVLLSNAPDSLTATQLATLYLSRWTIELMFQRLEQAFQSEIKSLGKPRAALFAFGTAIVAFNVLSTLKYAIEAEQNLPAKNVGLSLYHLTNEVNGKWEGMMIGVPPSEWRWIDDLTEEQVVETIRQLARSVPSARFARARRKPKPPKKPLAKLTARQLSRHVSTARVLRAGKIE
jgi:IS4 transposase